MDDDALLCFGHGYGSDFDRCTKCVEASTPLKGDSGKHVHPFI
jgi:hypothetical protein